MGDARHTLVGLGAILITLAFACPCAIGATLKGDPGNYLSQLRKLKPGDTLELAAGTYASGLPIHKMDGEPGKPLTVTGPESGAPALFTGRDGHDTVEVFGSSYIVVRNLELDGKGLDVFGVNGRDTSHDITIDGLTIRNHGTNQQVVGIACNSTPSWNWTIRNNVIVGTGTGMYLGGSEGDAPFVAGVIENNLVMNTIGYNIQIKHQNSRPDLPGMPKKAVTVIRNNVFCKAEKGKGQSDGARPNLLVGHFPESGDGSEDQYLIYGNFFYENSSDEALFQGEGTVALYNNLLVNTLGGAAVRIQRHNGKVKEIRVFNNTVVSKGPGIRVGGGDSAHKQIVAGNVVFASGGISAGEQFENVTGSYDDAPKFLRAPQNSPGSLDLFPVAGKLTGKPLDANVFDKYEHADRDFNDNKRSGPYRGAYEGGEGKNPGWLPQLERKPIKSPGELMAGPGPYVKLEALANQVIAQQGLGKVLATLRTKKDSADPQEKKEAAMMFESLGGEAQRRLDAALEAKATQPLDALERLDRFAADFAGDELAVTAKKEADTLRRDPKVRKEQEAALLWTKVEMLVGRLQPVNGKKDPKDNEFLKKNGQTLQWINAGCLQIRQRYPETAAAKRAEDLQNQYR